MIAEIRFPYNKNFVNFEIICKFFDKQRGLNRSLLKSGVSFWWSFGSNSAWGSIETTTIGKTHPTLEMLLKISLMGRKTLYLSEISPSFMNKKSWANYESHESAISRGTFFTTFWSWNSAG